MRLFIGIRIPEEIRKKIEEIEKNLKKKSREAKIVKPKNLHITLKFLGEVAEEKIKEIDEKLTEVGEKSRKFVVSVGKLGSFPEEKKIRVLWIGAESQGKLKKLNKEIEQSLAQIGFKEENRFKEHITIARFKSTPDLKFIDWLKGKYNIELGSFEVKSFFLIKSVLTPEGPIYENIKEYKLGG